MFRIILGLAILLPSFAFAGEWREKPVQCGSIEEIGVILQQNGEEYLLNGLGVSYDADLIAFPVQVSLWANLDTGTWSILETDGNEACVLSYGENLSFDLLDGKNEPKI
jgi:hypothetical protein